MLSFRQFIAEDYENLYHGTKSKFGAFDLKRAGKSDPGLVGKAIYFTPSKEQAHSFANSPHYGKGDTPRVVKASVHLEKPLEINDGKLPDGRSLTDIHPQGLTKHTANKFNKELKKKGHDGVVFKLGNEVSQVASFYTDKVRIKHD